MQNNTHQLLRGLAAFMAFLAGLFLMLAMGGAGMAMAQHASPGGQSAVYSPLHDGTPEGTRTEQPHETETHEVEPTETHEGEPSRTREPEATETHEGEPSRTRTPQMTETREVEPTETHEGEPSRTREPEATRTHEVEPSETREPEGTETHEVEPSETAEATGTRSPEPTRTHEIEPTETEHTTPTMTGTPMAANVPGNGSRYFPQTGKWVNGAFLQYWDKNGGLMQQGYPISGTSVETSKLNGKAYAVQYFERSVFEYHPENKAPYDVLLAQLGTFQYNQKYPNGAPGQVANRTNARYFPQTGHWVGGAFLQYWDKNGGLMQQGYPISEQFTEVSALDGKPYTVQYFERAVFEYHPENKALYNVLLSQLGTYQYKQTTGK